MRLRRLAALGAIAAAVEAVGHGQQLPPRFTAAVELVQIDVSVLDPNGLAVAGLSAAESHPSSTHGPPAGPQVHFGIGVVPDGAASSSCEFITASRVPHSR